MPKFSIIIPCLNEEKFLPHLLTSLAEQSEKDFEVIVVDGTSTDKTVQKAKTFSKRLPGLSVVVSGKASLPLQRNIGAQHAHGSWLIFIDADTILLSYFLERISVFVREKQPSFFTTWFRPDSEVAGDAMITLLANMMFEGSIIFHRPLAPGPLTVVKREVFELVGGYDESHAFQEDVDFSLRIYKQGISLQILRETVCVLSLRRMRKDGVLTFTQTYIRSALPVLFFNKALKFMPGYIMGGQEYTKNKEIKPSILRKYQTKLKNLLKDLLE